MTSAPQRFAFIGVTASESSINAVFPRWADLLGLGDVHFEPIDVPLDSGPQVYRAIVRDIRDDPRHRGALVTSHKVRLLRAARDQFDHLDRYAELCNEVSCISRRDGRLVGHAKDPITSGRALGDLLAPDHFAETGGDAVILGAGGSGLAIAVHLLAAREDRPRRITLLDTDRRRLAECERVLASLTDGAAGGGQGAPVHLIAGDRRYASVELVASDGLGDNDWAVTEAPPGSLVVNATGLGKDRPGSPVSDAVRFPRLAVIWELNYRGERHFLRLAQAQAAVRSLTIDDGWRYFVHGWSEVIAEVFQIDLTPQVRERLSDEAARTGA